MRRTLSMLKLLFLLTIFSQIFCINVSSENKLNAEVEKKVERKTAEIIQEKSNAFNINNNENKIKKFNEKEKVVEKEKKEKENNLFTLFALQQPPLERNLENNKIKNDVSNKEYLRSLQDSFITDEELQNIEKSLSDSQVTSSDNIENPTSLCEKYDFFTNDFIDDDTESFYDDNSAVNNDDNGFHNDNYSNLEDIWTTSFCDNNVDEIKTVNLNIDLSLNNINQENNKINEKEEFGEIITENKIDTNCNTVNKALSDENKLDCKEFSESQIGTQNHDFMPFFSGKLYSRIIFFSSE